MVFRYCLLRTLRQCELTREFLASLKKEVKWHGRSEGEAAHYCNGCEVSTSCVFTSLSFSFVTIKLQNKLINYKALIMTFSGGSVQFSVRIGAEQEPRGSLSRLRAQDKPASRWLRRTQPVQHARVDGDLRQLPAGLTGGYLASCTRGGLLSSDSTKSIGLVAVCRPV